ncbi:hypothetical protein BV898_08839 [Hypsibius exemplaris]|uniref:Kazal-like domain-containing protein n=1 Tax=Hypsibius exemplaris TaxID=2072580 RepID=A0A1W0WPK3_HYPEX|nr:hypothetical protein BV898_08839 [Hypsibius exemplaris]
MGLRIAQICMLGFFVGMTQASEDNLNLLKPNPVIQTTTVKTTITSTRAPVPTYPNVTISSALGPVVVRNYNPLGSIPLTTVQQTACNCGGRFTKALKVCGTDGKTYPTACQLKFAMTLNKGLGLRNNRACDTTDLFATKMAKLGGCGSDNQLVARKPSKVTNPRLVRNPIRVFCMNDGTEETPSTVFCRMAKNATLGIRIPGTCSEFATFNCQSRLLQPVPMFDPWQ